MVLNYDFTSGCDVGAVAIRPSYIDVQGDASEGSKPSNNALPGPPSKTIKYDFKAPYLPYHHIIHPSHHPSIIPPPPLPHARSLAASRLSHTRGRSAALIHHLVHQPTYRLKNVSDGFLRRFLGRSRVI